MGVKNYNLSKIYNFNLFDPLFIQQCKTESNVSRMLSFLPFKILKDSMVCESRLLAIPRFCLSSSIAHGRTHRQRSSSRNVPSQLGIRPGQIFRSTPLTIRHCGHNKNWPVVCWSSETLSTETWKRKTCWSSTRVIKASKYLFREKLLV